MTIGANIPLQASVERPISLIYDMKRLERLYHEVVEHERSIRLSWVARYPPVLALIFSRPEESHHALMERRLLGQFREGVLLVDMVDTPSLVGHFQLSDARLWRISGQQEIFQLEGAFFLWPEGEKWWYRRDRSHANSDTGLEIFLLNFSPRNDNPGN